MNSISVFSNNKKAAWFWFLVSVCLVVAFICQNYFLTIAHATRERVIIMDAAGTFHIAPVTGLQKAETMQKYIVKMAATSFLSRNPSGLDQKTLFRQIFSEGMYDKANKYMNLDRERFETKEIFQKVVVSKINIQETSEKKIIALAHGQLIRTWNFHNETETEILWFKIKFRLVRNKNLISNGRLPLIVAHFKLKTYKENPDS